MHTFRMHAVIQSRMHTISMIGSYRELQWNTQRKARLRAVLQITSAQQHAPIHFILPRLKLNRTGGSTHWRMKYSTKHVRYEAQKATDSLKGYNAATTSNQKQHGAHLNDYAHP